MEMLGLGQFSEGIAAYICVSAAAVVLFNSQQVDCENWKNF